MTKKNMTLPELAAELEIRNTAKKDYIVPSKLIRMTDDTTIIVPETNGGTYIGNEVIHQQFAQKLGIPANYYRRMQELAPDLLAANVNKWLDQEGDKPVLVRTFEHEATGNIARGLLSDRYGMIDNYDVLFAALDAVKQAGIKVVIKESNITDKRLYVHIVAPEIEVVSEEGLRGYLRDKAVQTGYGINAGLIITNSEVGYGSYNIYGRIFEKVCMNGLIIKDDAFRKVHLGAKMDQGTVNWSEKTMKKNLELIQAQTGDAVSQFLSEGWLSGVVQKIERARSVKLDNPLDTMQNIVKEVAKTVTLTDESKKNIINFFVEDGDTSASGVVQALTREAQNLDADSRFDMEITAFEILGKVKSFDHEFVQGKN